MTEELLRQEIEKVIEATFWVGYHTRAAATRAANAAVFSPAWHAHAGKPLQPAIQQAFDRAHSRLLPIVEAMVQEALEQGFDGRAGAEGAA